MSVDKSSLEAKSREGAGKGAARKLRAQGLVPAVIYGKHLQAPVHVALDPKSIRQSINTPHKHNTLITLSVGGGTHQVLLAANGLYAQMWERQQARKDEELASPVEIG